MKEAGEARFHSQFAANPGMARLQSFITPTLFLIGQLSSPGQSQRRMILQMRWQIPAYGGCNREASERFQYMLCAACSARGQPHQKVKSQRQQHWRQGRHPARRDAEGASCMPATITVNFTQAQLARAVVDVQLPLTMPNVKRQREGTAGLHGMHGCSEMLDLAYNRPNWCYVGYSIGQDLWAPDTSLTLCFGACAHR